MAQTVWVRSLSWRPVPADDKRGCRMKSGKYENCGLPVAYELNRSRAGGKERWWAYCPHHVQSYGHRIKDGEVQMEVAADSPAGKRGWVA